MHDQPVKEGMEAKEQSGISDQKPKVTYSI
jgi:hypothetical protein